MNKDRIEYFNQHDGNEIGHPFYPSAEKLNALSDIQYKALYVFEQRRLDNMPPPSVREIEKYLGKDSTSHVSYILDQLINGNFLEKVESEANIKGESRNRVIVVNFSTVRRINHSSEIDLPDVPGITSRLNKNLR